MFADTRTDADGAASGDATLDMGSRSSLHTGLHMSEDEHWEMNYHEAAIYLEVNDKAMLNKIENSLKGTWKGYTEV